MKILIIDNNIDKDCWGSGDLCRMVRVAPAASIYVRRAPQEDLPISPLGYDRIIVSGSKTSALDDAPWINQLIEFIKKVIGNRIPFLGVCYGHQVLARALGSKQNVRKASSPEYGWTHIQLLKPSTLFQGISPSFYSFSAHYDEVCLLPPGVRRLASSEACEIQACQLEDFPVYGIQFHPEKSIDEAKKVLSDRKKKGDPPHLLNPNRSDELFDPKVGETLFKNFLEI